MNGYTLKRRPIQSGEIFRHDYVKKLVIVLLMAFLGCDVFAQDEKVLTPENYQAAARKFPAIKSKAENGDAESQYVLGLMYSFELGVSRNHGEAANWIRKAAEQGYAPAEVKLASMYMFNGEVVREDYAEAAKWYRKVAEQGDPEGQRELGKAYAAGLIVPKDDVEAIKWFRKAAEQGDADAQHKLAQKYSEGQGVSQDYTEAMKWYLKVAEQGDEFAQFWAAVMYSIGRGVSQNYGEAVKWYRKAAEQGNAMAQRELAILYLNGRGVPEDFMESYKWANIAAAQSPKINLHSFVAEHEENIKLRDRLVRFLTREQIAEGQRRAAAFVAKKVKKRDRLWDAIDFMPKTSPPTSSGSGFFITSDGYLLTSSHVVDGAVSITVKTKQGDFPAKLVKADAVNDVALLKVSGSFHALQIVASHTAKLGDSVITIGFPNPSLQGVEPKLTRGEINSLAGLKDDPRHFQVSVAVQPGNSGGPLVDSSGNVVGIVTARLSEAAALRETGALPQAVNYALKSSFITAFLESTPEVISKLAKPETTKNRRTEDVVKELQEAAALVLVY